MAKMSEMTPEKQAMVREKNRRNQAAYRKRQNDQGLYQVPVYVNVEDRSQFWQITQAFQYRPYSRFEIRVGSMRLADGTYDSPARIVMEERNK